MKTLLLALVLAAGTPAAGAGTTTATSRPAGSPPGEAMTRAALRLAREVPEPALADLLAEIATDHPDVLAARARARALAAGAPRERILPDPSLGVTAWVLPPETRTGPQRFTLGWTQRIPGRRRRAAREEAVLARARAAEAAAGEVALARVLEARRLVERIRAQDETLALLAEDLRILDGFEELARARYETGGGIAAAVIRLHAERTRTRARILDERSRREGLVAGLSALAGRPVEVPPLAPGGGTLPSLPPADRLLSLARENRPLLEARRREITAAERAVSARSLEFRPDFSVGLSWTMVDNRDDAAGRLAPPEDNGRDVLALTASIRLPIRRERILAGVRQAVESRREAELSLDARERDVRGAIEDVLARLPLLAQQVTLFRETLLPQAEESLASWRAAFETGGASAIDLLDARRTLLEVRLGVVRAQLAVRLSLLDLEGALGLPLADLPGGDR